MTSFPPTYYICLVLAIIAALLTITFWVITFYKKITRSTVYNFVLNLSLVTCLQSVSYTLNWVNVGSGTEKKLYIDNPGLCKTQSVVYLFSLFSIELWMSIIVYRLYYEMCEMINRLNSGEFDHDENIESNLELMLKISTKSLIICYCIGYGIPLILIIIYGSAGVLGMGSNICWINSENGEIWKLVLMMIKGGSIIFSAIISFLVVKRQAPGKEKGCCYWNGKKITILFVPLIQIIATLPSGIYRILININKNYEILSVLKNIDVVCLTSEGIFYPLFFSYICGIYPILFPPKNEVKINNLSLIQI